MTSRFNEPIITNFRKGTPDDPHITITENHTIIESKVILSEMPDYYQRVIVTGLNKSWTERDKGVLGENEYQVDYQNKIVTFHPSHNNKQLSFKYKGKGNHYFPTSMIYTKVSDGGIVQTLKDLTDISENANSDAIEATKETIEATESAIQQANYAKEQADIAKQESSHLSQLKTDVSAITKTANENETTRISAEDARKTNETKRLIDESARFKAESERLKNEEERVANETTRLEVFDQQIADVTEKSIYAKEQGDYAKRVGDLTKVRWLAPVQDYPAILTTYLSPSYGDQVALISNGKEYRYTTEWTVMRQPSSAAVADMQRELQEMKDEMSIIDGGTFTEHLSSYAIDGGTF